GGKCANLGELLSIGVEVPPGFAVTAGTFRRFLEESGLLARIQAVLAKVRGSADPQAFDRASQEVRRAIEAAEVPDDIAGPIRQAYQALCDEAGIPDLPVAVRSSATGEDLPEASFAGQQDTYLNIQGAEAVVEHVRRCWSSLYTPRAIFYREEKGFAHDQVLISVAVQQMVPSTAAGVCFTLDPVTGDTTKFVIEGTWGLGEALVSGRVRPDRFVVDKASGRVVARDIAEKTFELVPQEGQGPLEQEVPPERQQAPCLEEADIRALVDAARRIERHYGCCQDIEYAVQVRDGVRRLFIVQARPETVWSRKGKPAAGGPAKVCLKGLAAGPGLCVGEAKVVLTPQDAAASLRPGDILVTGMTNPDWVPYMKIAGAIVTDDGGVTCHAAIVSREMGIPCIVGTRNATKAMRHGSTYTVDAKQGIVYEGRVQELLERKAQEAKDTSQAGASSVAPITSTKVYVNLSIPDLAQKVARETQADGVGLLRAEHLMLSVGKHPRLLIEEGGEQSMVDAFAEGIRKVAQPFSPRPVVYRFLDFKPDEYLHLPGGEKYEKEAGHVGPNPLIGYRGCFRYIKEPDIFRLECKAIRKVRDEFGLRNVHVMVPFVRTLREFRNAKRIMEEEGLVRSPEFRLWIMCEVPSTVLTIDRFVQDGLDGISFGTNDLTMLILGIDRDDASIQEIYDERNPAVLRAMSHVIRVCREYGVTTSVCGQAPSNHPEVVEFLVREGATSMSVNPDKVQETKHLVAAIERKILLDGMRNLRPPSQQPPPHAYPPYPGMAHAGQPASHMPPAGNVLVPRWSI
ncbi:MAG TPA: phosphoenolpyruvate synthase, partial [Candidatus Thermoplasmatota archaeon]|nr:phosphoenolpyruvate synthase [Candidatus Thermoplasmatota archaeon]